MAYLKADWRDLYVCDGGSAVLVNGRVMVLSQLATALDGEPDHAAELSTLASEMVRRFGQPAGQDATEATLAAIGALVLAGELTEVR
jgi:hypothetical protein